MTPTHVRLFAHLDGVSKKSLLALKYADAIVQEMKFGLVIVPIGGFAMGGDRMVDVVDDDGWTETDSEGVPLKRLRPNPWARHYNRVLAPIEGTYVNAACCEVSELTWQIPATQPGPNGTMITLTAEERHGQFRTPRVRNVFITCVGPWTDNSEAFQYDAIVLPSEELADAWDEADDSGASWTDDPFVVVPGYIGVDGFRLRDALLGRVDG